MDISWTSRPSDQYIDVTALSSPPDWNLGHFTVENTDLESGETYVTLSGVLPAIRYIKGVLDEKEEDIQEIIELKCVMAKKITYHYSDLDIHNFLLLSIFFR